MIILLSLLLVLCPCVLACDNWIWFNGTGHKGYEDDQGWDSALNQTCDLSTNGTQPLNSTCGQCDFGLLKGGIWYRFAPPLTEIQEVSEDFCEEVDPDTDLRGHCNGKSQAMLAPLDNGNFTMVAANMIAEDSCQSFGSFVQIKKQDCGTYFIYWFPESFNDQATIDAFCTAKAGGETHSYKTSFCLVDGVDSVSVDSEHQYYLPNQTVTVITERRPAPPDQLECFNSEGGMVELTADPSNGHYNRSYTFPFTDMSVNCTLNGPNATSLLLGSAVITAEDTRSIGGEPATAVCRAELKMLGNSKEIFYIEDDTGEKHTLPELKVFEEENSVYRLELNLSAGETTVPEDTRNLELTFTCGVLDSDVNQDFTLTLEKKCSNGSGFLNDTSTACSLCPANFFAKDSVCEPCPKGQISEPGASNCKVNRLSLIIVVSVVSATLVILIAIAVYLFVKWWRNTQSKNTTGADEMSEMSML